MDWGESLALTLNLQQCRHVTDLDKNRTFKIWITESDIHNTVRHFVNLLNRRMFGNHWKRDGRRLEVLAVSEKIKPSPPSPSDQDTNSNRKHSVRTQS